MSGAHIYKTMDIEEPKDNEQKLAVGFCSRAVFAHL